MRMVLTLLWLTISTPPRTLTNSPLSLSEKGMESINSELKESSLKWKEEESTVRNLILNKKFSKL